MNIQQLTPAEENIMQIMWKLNSAYLKDIIENFPEPKPHQNTVSTFVKILVDKEFISKTKEGRIFNYSVAVPYDSYRKNLLNDFVHNYFGGSGDLMVDIMKQMNLLSAAPVTPENEPAKIEESQVESAIRTYLDELTSDKKTSKNAKKKKKKKK